MTLLLAVPTWLAAVVLLAVVGLLLAVLALGRAVGRERRRTSALLEQAATDADDLRGQLEQINAQLARNEAARERDARAPVVTDDREYLITDLGQERREPAPIVPAPVFVDILVRESMIRTASLAAGLRRALSPEVRNRVRFEMKREVKRARKQRKHDLRVAKREYDARQRAALDPSIEAGLDAGLDASLGAGR